MDEAYAQLVARLAGLTDAESFWQPMSDCLTIHKDHRGRWIYDYAIPDPQPAPMTTIGWQLVHLALCKVMYHEWAFRAARLTWPELDVPRSVAQATTVLAAGQHELRSDLLALADEQLDQLTLTNWGERWPVWRVFWAMINHDALHWCDRTPSRRLLLAKCNHLTSK
jgi:hypothetical protein